MPEPREHRWREVAPLLAVLPLTMLILFGIMLLPRVFDSLDSSTPTIEVRANGGGENDSIAIPRGEQPEVRTFVHYSCAKSCEGGTLTVQARGSGVGDPSGVSASQIDLAQVTTFAIDGGRSAVYPIPQSGANGGGASITFPCTAGETITVESWVQSDKGSAQASAEAVCS